MTTAYHLTDDAEADLLAAILANLDPADTAQQHAADAILCDLIEQGLADMDAGPATFQAWLQLPPPHDPDTYRPALVAAYKEEHDR